MPIKPLKSSDVMVYDSEGNLLTNSHVTLNELKTNYSIDVYNNGVCIIKRLDGE
jgi:hypothetical protein